MTHTIYAVTLMLFGSVCDTTAAERQPTIPSVNQKDQDKRDSDAAEYRRRVSALGGKMLHLDDEEKAIEQKNKPKITDAPGQQTDVRARL